MSRTTRSLTCVLWLTLMGIAAAQSDNSVPGMASMETFSGGVTYGGTNFNIYHLSGDGVGYRNGFTQIGTLSPYWLNEDMVIASNNRLLITDTQQIGGNLGGLFRYLDPTSDRIFGANGYFDIDQSIYDNHYRQVGVGIETLGQWWDFRANGYFATTDSKNFIGAMAIGDDLTYWQHRVGFLGVGQYENAQSGGDWEFGMPLTPVTPWLRGYAGMYYYDAKANTPVGFRGRVEGWIADDLQLGVQVTQDRQYGTNVNASVNFQFAGFRPTRWFPNFTTQERMLMPVQRNWRVAAGKYEQVDFVPAINPRTNQPYFIDWVDNSRILAGNGTYENPFNYLPASSPEADLINVRVGDTTAIAPLSGSIALQDWQRLLGEGREHQFQAYARYGNITTPTQTYNLPEFTNTGLYPYLTSNGNIVTLASHNEVSAFNLINANGFAVTNTPAGSVDFNTNYLNIRDNAGGIILSDVTGYGQVRNVNALNNTVGGIDINSGNGPLFLSFQDVTSSSIPAGNQALGIAARADNGAITAEFNNVTTNGNSAYGILLTESNSGMQATLNNVVATGNGDTGLRADGVGGILNLSLSNVNTSNNTGRGIWVSGNGTDVVFNYNNLSDSGNGGDNIRFTLRNGSELTGGGLHDVHFDDSVTGSGIVFDLDDSRVGTVLNPFHIVNVTSNRNAQDGLRIIATGGARTSLIIEDSSFNGNDLDGISVTEFGDSVVRMLSASNFILDNGRDGFHFSVNDASNLTGVFAQNIMAGNGRSAFYGEVDLLGTGGSTANLLINDTLARNSGADGMRIISANGATVNVEANHTSFSGSGQTTPGSSGVRFDAVDSNVTLSLYNTPVQNVDPYPAGTQAFGMQLNLNNTDFVGSAELATFSNNLQTGVLINMVNDSTASLTLTDVNANGNGNDGLKAVVETGSDLELSATRSSFSNNGLAGGIEGSGMNLTVAGAGSELTAFLRDVTINENARHGILGLATGGSVLGLSMQGLSTADNNGLDGLNVSAFNSQFIGEIDSASFSNNRSGVVFVGAGAGPDFSSLTMSNVVADNNDVNGMRFDVSGGHQLLLDVVNSSFSSNGGYGIIGEITGAGSVVEINPFEYVLGNFNGNGGLDLHVADEGFLNANINGGSFTGNGSNGTFDGVRIAVDSAGRAIVCFDGTASNSNTGDGYDFSAVDAGSRIDVALQTSGAYGTLQSNSNAGQAVRFFVGPGASGTLFLDGDSEFQGNGTNPPVTYVVNGAALAAFTFTGSVDNSTGDGLNIQMTDVAQAYIDIHDGSLSNNAESGIDISLNNVTFGATPLTVSFIQGDFTANPFRIENMVIEGNGEEGIKIVGTDVIMPVGIIYNNEVNGNGTAGVFDGILLDLSGNSILADFSIGNDNVGGSGNELIANSGNGINVQFHDNTQAIMNIQGNTLIGNSLNNVVVNLPDNTAAELHIDNNTIDGDGIPGFQEFQVGLNFTGSTFDLFNNQAPANAMGAVGPTAIVELLNEAYAVYDKTTGDLLFSSSDEQFWQNAGIQIGLETVSDSRLIYDPTVNKWYAVAITSGINSGTDNRILLAVSITDDPLDGFFATEIDNDEDGPLFSTFDAFGIDRDGLYITTNNAEFSGGPIIDVSIFSIPKNNVTFFPSIADMTRFENLEIDERGKSIQPVTNFGPANGQGTLIAADYSVANGRLIRTDVLGANAPEATLADAVDITGVPAFSAAPLANQLGSLITSGGDSINSSVIQVGNSIWAAQAVAGSTGNSAVRWHEIDATTGAVLQSGTIQDPDLDYYFPSIAVNASGDVVIGMNGSGPSQAISSYAATARTSGGTTTFEAPLLLQAGGGEFLGNEWGLYSSTVVDPNDPNSFWTFQQIATSSTGFANQITQISLVDVPPVLGNTAGDGIQVNVLDNGQLLNSTINNNIANGNGDNGIHVTLRDNATINRLNIDGNSASDNGLNGVLVETPAGTPTISSFLSISGAGEMSNNGASGINVQLNNVLSSPNIIIDGTTASDGGPARTIANNGGLGVNVVANNTPLNNVTVANNLISENSGRGLNLSFLNSTSANIVTVDANQIDENGGDGIRLLANNTAINTVNVTNGASRGNNGHGLNLDLTNSPVTNLNIVGNTTGTTVGLGFFVDGSTFGLPFQIVNTSTSNTEITGFTFDISTNDFFPGANFDTNSPPIVNDTAASPFEVANGTDLTTGLLTVNGNPAPNFAIPDESQVMTATFNDFNPGEDFQWVVDLDQTPGGDEGYSGNELIGSTVTVNFSNGDIITGEMSAVSGSPQASTFIATSGVLGAGFSTNTDDGIHFDLTNSDIANILIDQNDVNSNGGSGINFDTISNSDIGSIASPIVISNNNINSNANDGIRLIDPDTNNQLLNFQVTDNSMDLNGGNGANFQVSNAHNLTLTMTGNEIGLENSGNLGMGTRVVINDTSTFTGNIGDANEAANTFTGNRDAGFGLIMNNNATGTLNVVNSSFNGSVDGGDTNFAGVGLGVRMNNNAALGLNVGDATEQNTSFNDNASHGFQLSMTGSSTITGQAQLLNIQANGNGIPTSTVGDGVHIDLVGPATISDLLVTGTAAGSSLSENTGNGFFVSVDSLGEVTNIEMQSITAERNEQDGLHFIRFDSGAIGPLGSGLVFINDAQLNDNLSDGIDITAIATDSTDVYVITNSTISSNDGRGMLLNLVADADLDVTVFNSEISDNGLSGIESTTNADTTDTPSVTLDVLDSTISGNGFGGTGDGDGIRINTPYLLTVDGTTQATSVISGNARDGINLRSSGESIISDTTIRDNGGDAIDIRSENDSVISTISRNLLQNNGGDGVKFVVTGVIGGFGDLFVDQNQILDNQGRGVNILTTGGIDFTGSLTNATISGNTIARNSLEGVYVVNTAAEDQADEANVDNLSSATMLLTDQLRTDPRTILNVSGNNINSNGRSLNVGDFIDASGLVIRVGTSDGSNSFTDPGGFANTRGGIVATVANNVFSGQFGGDVTFAPFISTTPPPDTEGTWTNAADPADSEFEIEGLYWSDPLARLDLTFTGNTGSGLVASNPDSSQVFYNNDEPVFKSRDINQTDPGPFLTGTRARNATRLASRAAPFNAPTTNIAGVSGNSNSFLYPGVGESTFRVFGGPAFANNGGGGGNFFTGPNFDFSSGWSIGGLFGEEPFLWGGF